MGNTSRELQHCNNATATFKKQRKSSKSFVDRNENVVPLNRKLKRKYCNP